MPAMRISPPKALQNSLLTLRDLAFTAGPFVLLAAALLVVAHLVLQPSPPRRVVLATGVDHGAYLWHAEISFSPGQRARSSSGCPSACQRS